MVTIMKSAFLLAIILVTAGVGFGQDGKMGTATTGKAKVVGAHDLVVAHERNAQAFTKLLLEMASGGNIADVGLARSAFAEIKRSVAKMDEIRSGHIAKMDAAMREKMKPMLDGMAATSAALNSQIDALDTVLKSDTPAATAVEAPAAALLLRLNALLAPEEKDMADAMVKQSPPSMDHHTMVMKNGEKAMGFSQTATTHHFLMMKDGGAIQVEANDSTDAANRDMIRKHLAEIAKQFKNGDFSTPFSVHSQVPNGVPDLQRLKGKITYTYEEIANGARVRITSNDHDALAAIHAFLKFQIEDHQTGDPMN